MDVEIGVFNQINFTFLYIYIFMWYICHIQL